MTVLARVTLINDQGGIDHTAARRFIAALVKQMAMSPRWKGLDIHDVTHKVWLKVFPPPDYRPEARTEGKLRCYVKKAVFHTLVDEGRRRYLTVEQSLDSTVRDSRLHAKQRSPESELAQTEVKWRIMKAINELPASERQVFDLRLRGMNLEEIAAELGISRDQARRRLRNATRAVSQIVRGTTGVKSDC